MTIGGWSKRPAAWPAVPAACPKCGAPPPDWRFQQHVSTAPPATPLRGEYWDCRKCQARVFYGEQGARPAEAKQPTVSRLERVLELLDGGRVYEPHPPDFQAMAAQLRATARSGNAAVLQRVQQAAEQLLERHGLRL